jgi:hypothetical protein
LRVLDQPGLHSKTQEKPINKQTKKPTKQNKVTVYRSAQISASSHDEVPALSFCRREENGLLHPTGFLGWATEDRDIRQITGRAASFT